MTEEERSEYLAMCSRIFVRALRDPHGAEEFLLSEGQAARLVRQRELRLRALCWAAYRELNAVRARDGVPRKWDGTHAGVDEGYWSRLTDALSDAAGTSNPWPDEDMKPYLAALSESVAPRPI